MAESKIKWKLITKKVNELKPYHKNPRNITEQGLKDLKKSVDKFGLAELITINTNNIIIGGHARWQTLKQQGTKECDCLIPNRKLSDKEVEELNIRLNKNIAGTWDFDILANEFEENELLDWGFSDEELKGLDFGNEKTDEELDDAPEPQKEAISKLGDLFLLDGKHRILCGDSTDKACVEVLMGGKQADMCFTDPPYGVNYDGGHANEKRREKLKGDETTDLYEPCCKMAFDFTVKEAPLYLWHAGVKGIAAAAAAAAAAEKAGYEIRCEIIWNKNLAQYGAISAQYKQKHEPCYYCYKKGKTVNWCGDTKQITVWDENRSSVNEYHPTQKPVALVVRAIKNHSVGLILDLFGGSGSTLVGCEVTNRTAYIQEIDPIYIDVILKRYHNLYPDKKIECLSRKGFDFKKLFTV